MLKKIQNVWNYILKKKKTTNNLNLFSIKNNFLFSNAVNNSLTFFIFYFNNLKLKKIKILNKKKFLLNFYWFLFFLSFLIFLSFLFFVFWIY